jgi:hypothetical protein
MLSEVAVRAILENGCQIPAVVLFELSVFFLVCAPKVIKLKPKLTENGQFDDFRAGGGDQVGNLRHTPACVLLRLSIIFLGCVRNLIEV